MEMPMPPMGAPAMGGAGAPPAGGGPDMRMILVEMLGQARNVAEQQGLDFDELVAESANASPEGGPMPPPPPPMEGMGPKSGAMGPGPAPSPF